MSEAGKVVVVTPNPAVDVTYECAHPRWHDVNQVTRVTRRAGGKGLNVASVLAQLDVPVHASGFLGGLRGEEIRALLADCPIRQSWAPIEGDTRSTTVIHAEVGATLFNEPGPRVYAGDWSTLTEEVAAILRPADVLVVSGSCPPGTEAEHLVGLLAAARQIGARAVLDTSGALLMAAAPFADVLKPNREELLQATGESGPGEGARALLRLGAGAVAVSAGADGMELHTRSSADSKPWRATPPQVVSGNPTGAGDAAVAAIAASLLRDKGAGPLRPEALASAVALSAAAVLMPTAGTVDLDAYRRFLPLVRVEPSAS